MAKVKLYESYEWLRRKWVVEKLTEEEIAKAANASQPTIHRWLKKYNLIRTR